MLSETPQQKRERLMSEAHMRGKICEGKTIDLLYRVAYSLKLLCPCVVLASSLSMCGT